MIGDLLIDMLEQSDRMVNDHDWHKLAECHTKRRSMQLSQASKQTGRQVRACFQSTWLGPFAWTLASRDPGPPRWRPLFWAALQVRNMTENV